MSGRKILNPVSGRFITYGGTLHKKLIRQGKMKNEVLGGRGERRNRRPSARVARSRKPQSSYPKPRKPPTSAPKKQTRRAPAYKNNDYQKLSDEQKRKVDDIYSGFPKEMSKLSLKPVEEEYPEEDGYYDEEEYSNEEDYSEEDYSDEEVEYYD